jgi:hypothetical protein
MGFMADWDGLADLWENQGQELTVRDLVRALSTTDPALPIRVAVYDGTERRPLVMPVEVGFVGQGTAPDAVLITVNSAQSLDEPIADES